MATTAAEMAENPGSLKHCILAGSRTSCGKTLAMSPAGPPSVTKSTLPNPARRTCPTFSLALISISAIFGLLLTGCTKPAQLEADVESPPECTQLLEFELLSTTTSAESIPSGMLTHRGEPIDAQFRHRAHE